MKNTKIAALAISALFLAACAQNDSRGSNGRHHGHDHGGSRSSTAVFECDNGLTVKVQRAGDNRVRLTVNDREAVMVQAPSGSGERYTASSGLWGKGGEWHQKGGEAYFAYTGVHGNQGNTVCRESH